MLLETKGTAGMKQKHSVVLEIAVLRYRGLQGTESLSLGKLVQLCRKSLEDTFENHLFLYEGWDWEPNLFQKEDDFVRLISDRSHIATWPVVSFDLFFHKKPTHKTKSCTRKIFGNTSFSRKSTCAVRIHVASDVPKTNQVKERAIKFCLANEIVVVNNLFSFSQSSFDYISCAELDVLDVIKSHFSLYAKHSVANAIFSSTF